MLTTGISCAVGAAVYYSIIGMNVLDFGSDQNRRCDIFVFYWYECVVRCKTNVDLFKYLYLGGYGV